MVIPNSLIVFCLRKQLEQHEHENHHNNRDDGAVNGFLTANTYKLLVFCLFAILRARCTKGPGSTGKYRRSLTNRIICLHRTLKQDKRDSSMLTNRACGFLIDFLRLFVQ